MADNDTTMASGHGAIALVALCHEYCLTVDAAESIPSARDFARRLLGLLPRIYITAFGLPIEPETAEDIPGVLDEDQYASVSASLSRVFGENDTYLDTFHEDMKYSDSPIASSLSEQLADLYQAFYDFTMTVRELPADSIEGLVADMALRFNEYWSETLCNALRVLNHLYATDILTDSEDLV